MESPSREFESPAFLSNSRMHRHLPRLAVKIHNFSPSPTHQVNQPSPIITSSTPVLLSPPHALIFFLSLFSTSWQQGPLFSFPLVSLMNPSSSSKQDQVLQDDPRLLLCSFLYLLVYPSFPSLSLPRQETKDGMTSIFCFYSIVVLLFYGLVTTRIASADPPGKSHPARLIYSCLFLNCNVETRWQL